ncbi:MAG: PAS domain S-box protein [bacterium]
MSIRAKLLIGIISIAVIASLSGIFGYLTVKRIAESFEGDEAHIRSVVSASNEVVNHIKRAETHLYLYLALGDKTDKDIYENRIDSVLSNLAILDSQVDSPEVRFTLNNTQSEMGRFQAACENLLAHYEEIAGSLEGFDHPDKTALFEEISRTSSAVRRGGIALMKFHTDFLNRQESITASTEVISYVKRAEGHILLGLMLNSDPDIKKFYARTASLKENIAILTARTRIPEANSILDQISQAADEFSAAGDALIKEYTALVKRNVPYSLHNHEDQLKKLYSFSKLVRLNATSILNLNVDFETSQKRAALKEAENLQINILIVAVVTLAISLLLGFNLSRSISVPIVKLREATNKIARGNLDIDLEPSSKDELGELTASFASMTHDLKRYETVVLPAMEHMDNILQTMNDSLIVVSRKGKIETVNTAATTFLGYSETEMIGRTFDTLFAEKDSPIGDMDPDQPEQLISINNTEATMISRDGTVIPVIFSATPMYDDDNSFSAYVCAAVNITDRKNADEALEKSEEKFRSLFEESLDTVYFCSLDGIITDSNPAGLELLDCSSLKEVRKINLIEKIYPEKTERDFFRETLEEKGLIKDYESTFTTDAGLEKIILNSATLIRDTSGKATGYQGILRDITERRAVRTALREANTTLSALFDASPLAIVVSHTDGIVRMWNPAAEEMFGWSEKEVLGKPIPIIPETRESEYIELFGRASMGESIRSKDVVRRRKDGTLVNVSLSTAPLIEDDYVQRVVAIFSDITRRKQAEEALRESSARYRAVVEDMPSMVCRVDADGIISFVNETFSSFFNSKWEEMVGKNIHEIIKGVDAEITSSLYTSLDQNNPIASSEQKIAHPDGSERWLMRIDRALLDSRGNVTEFQSVFNDITELKLHEEEAKNLRAKIQEAQKLESLGVLAGGIAHDFNNILMGILGNISLLQMKLDDDSPLLKNTDRIEKAAQRAAELTNQMLAYSGRGKFVIGKTDLSTIVKEMTELLSAGISKDINIDYNLSEKLPFIKGDTSQIQQLVMNLITNAADAIEDGKGTVLISTNIVERTTEELTSAFIHDDLEGGLYSFLEVKDDGIGMDDETKARIFDPFFSTKETGRGLGLAAALGIVRGHSGSIQVESKPGKGTSVKVFLPFSTDVPERAKPAEEAAPEKWEFTGTALVVDDEEAVLEVAKMILELVGFEVLTAEDGKKGIKIYRKDPDAITFVLLDVTMPGMTGDKVLKEIIKINSDAKVILSSGYTEQEVTAGLLEEHPDVLFIQKPYRPEKLMETIYKLLDG